MNHSHGNIAATGTYTAAAYIPVEKTSTGQGAYLADNRQRSVAQSKQVEALANGAHIQRKANNNGLPDQLKSGVESLSGHSMDDVQVHYNSDKPAQLSAHAYAQGTDIHIAARQEKYLPHEAWHVVQQKQGRVRPTLQMKGKVNINDDKGLENEADVMGAASASVQLCADESARQGKQLHIGGGSNTAVAQGRFFKGYRAMTQHESQQELAGLLAILTLAQQQILQDADADFQQRAASPDDSGTFYHWIVGRLGQDANVIDYLKRRGLASEFRSTLETVGRLPGGVPVNGPIVPTLNLKDFELDPANRVPDAPPSPRPESRLIQIPRLVSAMQTAFQADDFLRHFHYILGGGAALAVKRPGLGRLGRTSPNMRDIDMDFQIIPAERAELIQKIRAVIPKITNPDALMEFIKRKMILCLFHIPDGLGAELSTDDVTVSGRNTVMFNKGDMEYSFHFVNDEQLLGTIDAPLGNGTSVKLIDDASHWALTKSALRARLKRPDKIQKTLIDACVQIGPRNGLNYHVRMLETSAILFGGARYIGTAQNTLWRLAGPAIPGLNGGVGQQIDGLSPATALLWQNRLGANMARLYDRGQKPRPSPAEMQETRDEYAEVFRIILNSIIVRAGAEGRVDVEGNARTLLRQFQNRFGVARARNLLDKPNIQARRGMFVRDAAILQRPQPQQHPHTIHFERNQSQVKAGGLGAMVGGASLGLTGLLGGMYTGATYGAMIGGLGGLVLGGAAGALAGLWYNKPVAR